MCFTTANLYALLKLPARGQNQEVLGFPTFSLVQIAECVFQPLLQAVIDADRVLQVLTQVLDLNKVFFQQVSPCCRPPRHGEEEDG